MANGSPDPAPPSEAPQRRPDVHPAAWFVGAWVAAVLLVAVARLAGLLDLALALDLQRHLR